MSQNKNCRVCKIDKEQLAFKKSKYYKSGYSTICKDCHNLQSRVHSKTEKGKLAKKLYLSTENGKNIRKNTCARYYQTKVKNRLKNDEKFKIAYNLRVSIAHVIKQKGFYKKNKLKDILGCSLEFLKTYLEETFKNNYNRGIVESDIVEIDHIVPISSAQTVEKLYELNHFTNLQMLLRSDNRRKSAKMEYTLSESK
jgi:hypothetical protein